VGNVGSISGSIGIDDCAVDGELAGDPGSHSQSGGIAQI